MFPDNKLRQGNAPEHTLKKLGSAGIGQAAIELERSDMADSLATNEANGRIKCREIRLRRPDLQSVDWPRTEDQRRRSSAEFRRPVDDAVEQSMMALMDSVELPKGENERLTILEIAPRRKAANLKRRSDQTVLATPEEPEPQW